MLNPADLSVVGTTVLYSHAMWQTMYFSQIEFVNNTHFVAELGHTFYPP